jgi:hypothetical protein
MLKEIFRKIGEILMPIIFFLIFLMIVVAIYAAIFKISFNRLMATVFIPLIALILSLFDILWMILQLPYQVYLFLKNIYDKIIQILAMIINIFNYFTSLLYFSNDDLF